MDELYQAKYLLGLSMAEVDDEIRLKFSSSIDYSNEMECNNIFSLLIFAVIDGIKNDVYTKEFARSVIKTEFVKLGLEKIYGDYLKFDNFINLVLDSYGLSYSKVNDFINIYQSFIEVADEIDGSCKTDIYYSVLCSIVHAQHVLINPELTQKITNHIDNCDRNKISYFAKLVSETLDNIRRNS